MQDVSEVTGINRSPLSRILSQKGYGTNADMLVKLWTYSDCKVEDLKVLTRD